MDDDLAEIALNSLEKAENADNEQNDNGGGSENASESDKEQEDTTNTKNEENSSDSELEGNTAESEDEDNSDEESEEETENDKNKEESLDDNEKEEKVDKSDEDVNKKEEMSDEEFEKLAKERGYSKKADQDAEKQRQRNDRNALANATRRPSEVDKDTWNSMPTVNKVIYNNLPYINAVGKDGNIIKIKTPQQLPDDFEFANRKAELQFQSDMQEQTIRAEKANEQIQRQIQNMKVQQERTEHARAIVSEVEALQKSGDLPTPTAKPGTKEFDSDEAVIFTNKVLGYYEQRIANGDRMTIKDALVLYNAMNPSERNKKAEVKGDKERKQVAKKISGVNKSSDTSSTKNNKMKYFKPGMDVQDIVDRALEDMD